MMKKIVLLLTALLLAHFVQAQDPRVIPARGKNISEFIPRNYVILDDPKPDMNGDGIEDALLVLDDTTITSEDDSLSRIIVILFKTAEGFETSAVALHAIDCKHCGGVGGDPFQGVRYESKRKSIFISHWGGSRWAWASEYQFRYQEGGWYLIGSELADYDKLGLCEKLSDNIGSTTSTNYLTGDVVEKVIDEKCKLTYNKKKEPKRPLQKLSDFRIQP